MPGKGEFVPDEPLPPCPQCGGELVIEQRFVVVPGLIGGSTPKVLARSTFWLVCMNDACPFEEEGRRG